MKVDYAPEGGSQIILAIASQIRHLEQITPRIEKSAELVYEATRIWHDSEGEGTWPKLATGTVSKKASQGMAEPSRPLYAEGNLYESVTSRSGPYSFFIPWPDAVLFGVDWRVGVHQIPDVLAGGTRTSGRSRNTVIPPRPIWPPITSSVGITMMRAIGAIILGAPNIHLL